MTIDERLDRLTECHEALSESVELLATARLNYDRRIARANRRIEELSQQNAEAEMKVAALTELMAGLVQLARRHEERLDRPGI